MVGQKAGDWDARIEVSNMHINKHFPASSNSLSNTQFKSLPEVPDRRHHIVLFYFFTFLNDLKLLFFLLLNSLGTGSMWECADCLVIALLYLKVSSHLANGVSFPLSLKLFPSRLFPLLPNLSSVPKVIVHQGVVNLKSRRTKHVKNPHHICWVHWRIHVTQLSFNSH